MSLPYLCPNRFARRMAVVAALWFVATTSHAQLPATSLGNNPVQFGVGQGGPSVDIPKTNLAPIGPQPNAGLPPSGMQGAPPPLSPGPSPATLFDPYANSGVPSTSVPSGLSPNGYGSGLFGRMFSPQGSTAGTGFGSGAPQYSPAPTYSFPPPTAPYAGTVSPPGGSIIPGPPQYGPPQYGPPQYGPPAFPSSIYPSTAPQTLFPDGLFPNTPITPGFSYAVQEGFRALRGPRFSWSYILRGNSGPDKLGINDMETSVVFAFPQFLYSTQPWYISPGFSLNLWDGPVSTGGPNSADLPAQAYGAYLDFSWQSDPNRLYGAELGVRVGAFTDFDTFNDESIRVMGKGLGSFRLTPASTLKLGVYYLDRIDIKLLPAGGVLWQPNPATRFDIFFPEPKFARYCRTIGTKDVWWYVAGRYGGGSWTIERANGSSDAADINDLRVSFGLESGPSDALRAGNRTMFFEIGYVFNREVIYRHNPQDNFDPTDSMLFQAGIGY